MFTKKNNSFEKESNEIVTKAASSITKKVLTKKKNYLIIC